MKIEKIDVYGYGKWVDQIFEIDPNLQIFKGSNEAGKTTIMSFIHSIFFGFPQRNSQDLRYEPKNSSKYGGKIYFTDSPYGNGFVERVGSPTKSSGKVYVETETGYKGEEAVLDQILYSTKEKLFKQIFSFTIDDLQEMTHLSGDEFNRNFISLITTGSNDYLSLADSFEKHAQKLYKPSGKKPELNVELQKLGDIKEKLNRAKSNNTQYMDYMNQASKLNKDIEKIEKQKKDLDIKNHELNELTNQWPIKEEMDRLESFLKHNQSKNIPENGLAELSNINKRLDNARNQRNDINKEKKELKIEHNPSEYYVVYEDNQQKVDNFEETWPSLQSDYNSYIRHKEQETNLQNQIATTIKDNPEITESSKVWDSSTQTKVEEIERQINGNHEKLNEIDRDLAILEGKIETNKEHIDNLEAQMDPKTQENESPQQSPSKNSLIVSGVGVLIILLNVINVSPVLLLVGFSLLAIAIYLGIKKGNTYSQPASDDNNLKASLRESYAVLDKLTFDQNELVKEQHSLEADLQNKQASINRFLSDYGIDANQFDGNLKRTYQKVQQLNKLKSSLSSAQKQKIHLKDKLENSFSEVDFIGALFPRMETLEQKFDAFEHFINKVKIDRRYLEDYEALSGKLNQSLELIDGEEESLEKEKMKLFNQVNADSEDQFRLIIDTENKRAEKERRLNELKENNPRLLTVSFKSVDNIQDEISRNQNKISELKSKESSILENRAAINYDIGKIREGGEYSELLQEYADQESLVADLVEEWLEQKTAKNLIVKTLENGTEEKMPQLLDDSVSYFTLLTENKYKDIEFAKEGIVVTDQNDGKFHVSELSKGTKEPLFIAIRFAYIKNLTQQDKLPVIVDDSFVNLDSTRMDIALKLLSEISKYTQVLYFTFNERIDEYYRHEQITQLI